MEKPDSCFDPFIYEGLVSLMGEPEDERLIRILGDPGGSQVLILANLLPLSEPSSCYASTLMQGVRMSYVAAALRLWLVG